MSKAKVIVLSVVHQGLTKAEAARRYDVRWQWVHTLVPLPSRAVWKPWSPVPAGRCRTPRHPGRLS